MYPSFKRAFTFRNFESQIDLMGFKVAVSLCNSLIQAYMVVRCQPSASFTWISPQHSQLSGKQPQHSAHNTHVSKRERTLTLLLTSAESPNDGPLLKCCDMMRSDYLHFRELVTDAAAGHVFRHCHRVPVVQIGGNPILQKGKDFWLSLLCCGFWTTFRHFSESFLNSSHLCFHTVRRDWSRPTSNADAACSRGDVTTRASH